MKRVTLIAAITLTLAAIPASGQMLGLLFVHAPRQPFDPAKAPPAPNYAKPSSWAARPDMRGESDAVPQGVMAADPATAPADVFFVHPTSDHSSSYWNSDVADAKVNRTTDLRSIRNQASAFNGCCRIYAPRFRQMTLGGFFAHNDSQRQAEDLAYSDVKRAFAYYLAHDNHGRPFVIASHSQGTRLAERLIKEMIDGTPLMHRFVAAYLVGNWIDENYFAAMTDVKPCQRADDTGCVLTWSTLAEDADAQKQREEFVRRSNLPASYADRRYVCTNPLNWTTDGALAPASDDIGAWVYGSGDRPRALDPHVVSARCDDGALFVSRPTVALYRYLQLPGGNYHDADYQLFYMNIRQNAQTRVAAFLKRR